ncbi:MAG: hypothetical protein M3R70_05730 [Actinomycetota bacterium]|nr:hypothetical protein [Actinomycetota bacterium]
MRLVDQFRELEATLPDAWSAAHLELTAADEADSERAAALLGPTNPGLRGRVIDFVTARGGAGVSPLSVSALLRRLDEEGIGGDLKLVDVTTPEEIPPAESPRQRSLAKAWDDELAKLPEDWTDLVAEVEVFSSDYIEPAALAMSPLNPVREGASTRFRFRAARRSGYGAAPEMVRRCLERLDERAIYGSLRIVRVLSDTKHAYTQGPVWYDAGKVI